MPLKLNVGLSKKIGLPDYGSLGASCHVEVELEGSLLETDLDGFHCRVKNAFVACRQAVQDELARNQGETSTAPRSTNGHAGNGNGQHAAGNGHAASASAPHRASQKQLDYASQLSRQIRGLGVRKLESLAAKMFSKPLADLNSLEASTLIDTLRAIKDGQLSVDQALDGAPA